MSDLKFTIVGLEELQKLFKVAPEKAIVEIKRAVQLSALIVQRMARKEAPIDRGILRNSIAITFQPLGATVTPAGAAAKYALFVDQGTRPHFPPIMALTGHEESLDLWARRHGVDPFVVALGIARKGTKPNQFMERAFELSQHDVQTQFDNALHNLTGAL